MGIYQPFAFLRSGWKHRELIQTLARRKIELRYRGSQLGFLWTIINPLMLLAVYTFVFSFVFKSRWGASDAAHPATAEFSLYLFSGMILYSVFAECVNEAPGLILQNSDFVKQHIFPLETLPWVSLLATLFNFAVGMSILVVFFPFVLGVPPISLFYLPLILLPIVLLTLGTSWFLASLGVFLRDISQVVSVLTTALLFLSPIFYPVSRIPEQMRDVYNLNPFARIIEMSKGVIFHGSAPDWWSLAALCLGGWIVAWLGYVCFMKSKHGFADVV
jgi:lipopolysaccharide transport system permease protein